MNYDNWSPCGREDGKLLDKEPTQPRNRPKALTHAQTQALRRMLHIVGRELIATADSQKLPDTWHELNHLSYTKKAIWVVYDMMAETGIVPKREG